MTSGSIINDDAVNKLHLIDQKLSQRFIALDPNGYFLIKLDTVSKELIVEHYTNDIDDHGRAIDPDTGQPLSCTGNLKREPLNIYRGRTAKEVGIKLTEGDGPFPLSRLDHALYLGRELQKAEGCLKNTKHYVQD